MCLSETQAKKRQREEDISVSAVQKPLILLMVFVLVLKINAIIQTILRITDNGVSIGTKIKKMVLTHLGSGAISRIPANVRSAISYRTVLELNYQILEESRKQCGDLTLCLNVLVCR